MANSQSDFRPATQPGANSTGLSDNTAAAIAYITIIPAILFLILPPFKGRTTVRFNAWQSVFFYLAWAALNIILSVLQNLLHPPSFLTFSFQELIGLVITALLIIVVVNTFNGKKIVLPIIGPIAQRQSTR